MLQLLAGASFDAAFWVRTMRYLSGRSTRKD